MLGMFIVTMAAIIYLCVYMYAIGREDGRKIGYQIRVLDENNFRMEYPEDYATSPERKPKKYR